MAAKEMKPLGGFYLAAGFANEYMTIFLALSCMNRHSIPTLTNSST